MKAIDPNLAEKPGFTRKRWFGLGFVVVMILVAVLGIRMLLKQAENPVKNIDVTQLNSVSMFGPSMNISLDVHPQLWSQLIANFQSSSLTWNSVKWEGLAVIQFNFKDQSNIQVTVFDTGTHPGRFRVGNFDYVGGDERMLTQILDDEFKRQKRASRVTPER